MTADASQDNQVKRTDYKLAQDNELRFEVEGSEKVCLSLEYY